MTRQTTIASTPALRAYADWVRPKVLRVDHDAYSSAVRSFLDASPNDFGHAGLTDMAAPIEQEVEDVEAHNRKAEDFADQLEAWDEEFGLNPRDGVYDIWMTPEEWQELQDRWATYGDGVDLLESAEDLQAAQYANDVLDVLADDDLDPDERREALQQVLDDFEGAGLHLDPSAQDTFVTGVGAEGLNTLYDQASFAEAGGSGPWDGILRDMSEHVAATANRMDADELRTFMEGMYGHVIYATARLTPWDDAATTTAVEHLWGDSDWPMPMASWPNSIMEDLDAGQYGEGLPTSWRAAAAGLLADNSSVAHDFLTDHDNLVAMVYEVDSSLAGRALDAARDKVTSDLAGGDTSSYTAMQAAFADLVDHHAGTDGFGFWDGEDQMTDPGRLAVANLGGLFLHDLANVQQRDGGVGAFEEVSPGDLEYFYAQVFKSDAAQEAVAQQVGIHAALRWDEAVGLLDMDALPRDFDAVASLLDDTVHIDELTDLFTGALEAEGANEAARREWQVGVLSSASKAITSVGIAASPLTGGASAVTGAGAGFVIQQVTDQIPIPSFDGEAHARGERGAMEDVAVNLLVENHEALDRHGGEWPTGNPYNLSDGDWAQLSGEGLPAGQGVLDRLASTSADTAAAAREELEDLLYGSGEPVTHELTSEMFELTDELRSAREGDG